MEAYFKSSLESKFIIPIISSSFLNRKVESHLLGSLPADSRNGGADMVAVQSGAGEETRPA